MAKDMTTFFDGYKAPDRDAMTKALAGLASEAASLGGKALMRLSKDSGVWVCGMDNTPLKEGEHLVVDPASISAGYIAWYKGAVEGEVMQPIHAGPVDPQRLTEVKSGTTPPGANKPSGRGWEPQVSVDLVSRDEVPLQLVYKTSALGGRKALLALAGAVAVGLQENPKRVYPVIELGTDNYTHKEYGLVYTPLFTVVEWLDAEGGVVPDTAAIAGKGNGLL